MNRDEPRVDGGRIPDLGLRPDRDAGGDDPRVPIDDDPDTTSRSIEDVLPEHVKERIDEARDEQEDEDGDGLDNGGA